MKFKIVFEPSDEGGYTVYVPSLPGCISEGDSEEEAWVNIYEAIELYTVPNKRIEFRIKKLRFPISSNFILSHYIDRALIHATYEKLEDDSYGGRIPPCIGVVAFGKTLRECEDELRSTLEDWILVGLMLGHKLPVFSR